MTTISFRHKSGISTIGYSILAALVAVTIIYGVSRTGITLSNIFGGIGTGISKAESAGAANTSGTGIALADPPYQGGSMSCNGVSPYQEQLQIAPGVSISIPAGSSGNYCVVASWHSTTGFTSPGSLGAPAYIGEYSSSNPANAIMAFPADSTSAGTPWAAVLSSPSQAAAIEQACRSGQMGALPNSSNYDYSAAYNMYATGVPNGVPVVSTASSLPAWEVNDMSLNGSAPYYMSQGQSSTAFQPTQTVVTCELP